MQYENIKIIQLNSTKKVNIYKIQYNSIQRSPPPPPPPSLVYLEILSSPQIRVYLDKAMRL